MLLLFTLISILIIPLLCLFLGLQVISLGDYVKAGFTEGFRILLDYTKYREYPEFLYLILVLSLVTVLSFLWNTLFSYNVRQKHKHRFMTLEERKRVSHLAWIHEAKKGTTRIEFDRKGQSKGDNTIRGQIDLFFDGPKRLYNKIIELFRLPDVRKLNTLKTWSIEDRKVHRRAGPPIVTRRNAVWVDAEDTHTMVSGTTRAGKGFFIISILLQIIRMCRESVIVMDVKGEHYKTHAQSFMDEGYDVLKVDFIEPKKSLRWNPFGIIIRKYREAYERYSESLLQPEYRKIVQEILINSFIINGLKKREQKDSIIHKIETLEEENRELEERLPKPNYSEAQELISDIAMRLCHEEDARDPFWSSSATTILEGYINFLLEERVKDENGKLQFLPDEMINMRSVKMLHEMGKEKIDSNKNNGCRCRLCSFTDSIRQKVYDTTQTTIAALLKNGILMQDEALILAETIYSTVFEAYVASFVGWINNQSYTVFEKINNYSSLSVTLGLMLYETLNNELGSEVGFYFLNHLILKIYTKIRTIRRSVYMNKIVIYTPFYTESCLSLTERIAYHCSRYINEVKVVTISDMNSDKLSQYDLLLYFEDFPPENVPQGLDSLKISFFLDQEDRVKLYSKLAPMNKLYQTIFADISWHSVIEKQETTANYDSAIQWIRKYIEDDKKLNNQLNMIYCHKLLVLKEVFHIVLFTDKDDLKITKVFQLNESKQIENAKIKKVMVHIVNCKNDLSSIKTAEALIRRLGNLPLNNSNQISEEEYNQLIFFDNKIQN